MNGVMVLTLDIAKRFMDISGIRLLGTSVSQIVIHETRKSIPDMHVNDELRLKTLLSLSESHSTLVKDNDRLIEELMKLSAN